MQTTMLTQTAEDLNSAIDIVLIIFLFTGLVTVFLYTNKYGGYRGLVSATGHLILLLLGWRLGKWLGIIFISLPFIALYYYILYRFSEVIILPSDPESHNEKIERFKVFTWYMWGVQYPVITIPDRPNAKAVTHINGSVFKNSGAPGYVWTNAYQVIGLTGGTSFTRVEGPGAIYTRRFERVQEVIDLRTQLRTKEIDAITRNGIPIRAVLFASFCVDRLPFDQKISDRLRHAGSYPYSRPRVQAALSLEGVNASSSEQEFSALRWDEQTMSHIEEISRQVIAEMSLEELWHPNREEDGQEVSSLDLIARKIREQALVFLHAHGVHLYSARIVNYHLLHQNSDVSDNQDIISAQQLPVWISRLEKISNNKMAEVTAELEQKQLDASVVASTMILKSIAESLQNAPVKTGFSRYIIAMRYLNILYDMVQEQPKLAGKKGEELMQKISILRGY
jgi:hypothetical protein